MPTSVALNSHFEHFIRDQVESGRFNNASEVVRAGLRLLEDQQTQASMQREALRAAIASGMASGPGIPADNVFDRLEAKYRAMAGEQPA
ncbi:type II toxin-antitoxin system ParD family antitoxin [uncultured Thiocystis sp.]|uniref:type II toxin-antitoxin system ParD family antitoxin n=1 Tax=uncultured Thiocystis sp. TaxID=1202134 RepID=UPI0025DD03C0|nr:type II toxin-antitoxin system ParD family antitoxin [uncultured Thiocystis sp.]